MHHMHTCVHTYTHVTHTHVPMSHMHVYTCHTYTCTYTSVSSKMCTHKTKHDLAFHHKKNMTCFVCVKLSLSIIKVISDTIWCTKDAICTPQYAIHLVEVGQHKAIDFGILPKLLLKQTYHFRYIFVITKSLK